MCSAHAPRWQPGLASALVALAVLLAAATWFWLRRRRAAAPPRELAVAQSDLALFKRRLGVFNDVQDLLSSGALGTAEGDAPLQALRAVESEASQLFEPAMGEYLRKVAEVYRKHREVAGAAVDPTRPLAKIEAEDLRDCANGLQRWMAQEARLCRKRFEPFLMA